MSFFRIKIRPNDKLWTKYIRLRDKNICYWCGQLCDNPRNSGVSHFRGRVHEGTRYDDENSDLMHNLPCHREAEKEKQIKGISNSKHDGQYTEKKKKQLGEFGFNALYAKSMLSKKIDDKMDALILKELIKTLVIIISWILGTHYGSL